MSSLVGILTAQHRAIEKRVASIREALELKDTMRIYVELPTLRSAVVSHLRLEASTLYPRIGELAQEAEEHGDTQLAVVGREFAASVAAIGEAVERFVDRHSSLHVHLESFAPEWEALVATLSARIRSEEERLYTAFTQAADRRLSSLGFAQSR